MFQVQIRTTHLILMMRRLTPYTRLPACSTDDLDSNDDNLRNGNFPNCLYV